MADSKKISIILGIVLGAILLVAATAAATIMLYPTDTAKAPEADAEAGDAAADASDKAKGEPQYLDVEIPPVNLGPDDPKRFIQLKFQLMTHDKKLKSAVKKHMPAVRNELILLLSDKSSKALATREGKQALRESMRKRIESVMADKSVKGSISKIYLTRMVMQ